MLDKIRDALGLAGSLEPLAGGAFRLRADNGDGDFFIRLDPHKRYAAGDAIAGWAAAQGLKTNAPLPGFPRDFDGGHVIAYPWRDTRDLIPADMPALGRDLRRLHNVLGRHPDAQRWRDLTDRILLDLTAIRVRIAGGELKVSQYYEGVADLARNQDYDFVMHGYPRIACHMGDARVDTATGEIVFFNFRNVPAAYLPAAFEFARVIERHILQSGADLSAAAAFLKAYGVEGRLNLGRIMLANIVRACCALAATDIPAEQWQRIFDLYTLIRRHEAALDALEAG